MDIVTWYPFLFKQGTSHLSRVYGFIGPVCVPLSLTVYKNIYALLALIAKVNFETFLVIMMLRKSVISCMVV